VVTDRSYRCESAPVALPSGGSFTVIVASFGPGTRVVATRPGQDRRALEN